ncbi:unnamed protein product [Clonostachys chloroleuca]|uniref:AAA+ ATPase domain-containing protein n=1 Tax=Clonostachys chloroleuca TaxID=1926264 RepID=A0AA35LVV0_9HYPO|nr:unnamed protein product [Clonostachys chloroleuca]
MSVASDIQVIRHGGRDGFESDSASSVSSVSRRRSYRRRKSFRAAKEPFKVDGKVPDVVHTLEYINQWDNSILGSRYSATAFKKIPENHYDDADTDLDADSGPIERPVLEIVTSVYSRTSSRRGGRPMPPGRRAPAPYRARAQGGGRPVTAAFDAAEYGADEYNSEFDEVEPRNSRGPETTEPLMKIYSEPLRNALRAVVAYYPYARLTDKELNIPAPYRALYHHRDQLAHYRNHQPASHTPEYAATTAKHIDILLSFLDEANGKDISREEDRHKRQVPVATFEYFWLLLKPGEVVYAKRFDIWTPYVISNIQGNDDIYPSYNYYRVHAWHLESNGSKVERFMDTFSVPPWHGEQAISSLPVVPARFWKEDLKAQGGRSMREKCIAEGKLYWDLLKGPAYMEYDGFLVTSGSGSRLASGPTGFMCGRVICDAEGFSKYSSYNNDMVAAPPPPHRTFPGGRRPAPPPSKDHLPKSLPRCPCEICIENAPKDMPHDSPYTNFEDLDPVTDTPPDSELFYLVLSNTIPAFILGQRRWGHLNLEYIKPVKTDKEAFKYLVLDDEIKLTVKALIGKFAAGIDAPITPWGNDFVKNKGEGRIFLLHGDPGVGKTCTAECIAELTNRPLISLTSGDLSVNSYHVEHKLSYFLELGHRYGALVLLDEADVYLERRRSKDISRNGLVSVFLRALEYYRGVLFLTTNRVQSFDTAFLSRIHVALHYKNLTDDDRERIWTNNFERLDRDSSGKVHVSVPAREYIWNSRDVRSLGWNGREIRNAMQTALALAENEAKEDNLELVTISEKHMRAVVKISSGFRDFIKTSAPLNGGEYELSSEGEADSEREYSDA